MLGIYRTYQNLELKSQSLFESLEDLALLSARFYVSWIFLKAGLLKLQSWETTLMLFEYEYSVPLLSPGSAAVLGTFGEIVFPILLIAGVFTRFSAVSLGVVNIVAAISLSDIGPAALLHHYLWGALLAALFIRGAGRISIDKLFFFLSKRKNLSVEITPRASVTAMPNNNF